MQHTVDRTTASARSQDPVIAGRAVRALAQDGIPASREARNAPFGHAAGKSPGARDFGAAVIVMGSRPRRSGRCRRGEGPVRRGRWSVARAASRGWTGF